jgi:hypothetical protein
MIWRTIVAATGELAEGIERATLVPRVEQHDGDPYDAEDAALDDLTSCLLDLARRGFLRQGDVDLSPDEFDDG